MTEFPPVLTKADFVRRYRRREFGNASPTWDDLGEFVASPWEGYDQLYHLRNRAAGGATHYNLSRALCVGLWSSSADPEGWYASAMAPERLKILQGEVMLSTDGLYLYYNTLPLPMREGMAEAPREARGVTSVSLLRAAMCPNSYEWLQVLLDRYPGHVVEFSTYSVHWGTFYPLFNTCFWEVRTY